MAQIKLRKFKRRIIVLDRETITVTNDAWTEVPDSLAKDLDQDVYFIKFDKPIQIETKTKKKSVVKDLKSKITKRIKKSKK